MTEREMLIRMIRDYDPTRKRADLQRLTMQELALIYKQLRGY